MRIIQVINVRWFNATAWYAVELSRLLKKAGHEVLVLGLEGSPPLAEAKKAGLRTMALNLNSNNPFTLNSVYRALGRLVRDFKPHLVNCHRGESFLLWGLLRRKLKSFSLVRTRGDQRPPKGNRANRWLHGVAADALVVTNTAMARQCAERLNLSGKQIHLIYGGVDATRFHFDVQGRERVRKELGYTDKDLVIGLLGRFDRVKGQKELIEAASRLYHARGHRNIRLMLLGFPTALDNAAIQAWIKEWNARDFTVITGKQKDVAAWISAMDLGVAPSLYSEAIARAALEIMSCNRPLIATRVGVMPDLLTDAALADPGDVEGLMALMERFLTDAEYRSELAWDQQHRLAGLHSRDFLLQTEALYRGLVERLENEKPVPKKQKQQPVSAEKEPLEPASVETEIQPAAPDSQEPDTAADTSGNDLPSEAETSGDTSRIPSPDRPE